MDTLWSGMLALLAVEWGDLKADQVVLTVLLSAATWRAVQDFTNDVMLTKEIARRLQNLSQGDRNHTKHSIEDEEDTQSVKSECRRKEIRTT